MNDSEWNLFYRDASERLTVDFKADADVYPVLCSTIADHFDLQSIGKRVTGLEVMFCDYGRDGYVVGLEWDMWCGLTVVAKNPCSESLVRQIAEFLQSRWSEFRALNLGE